MLDRKQLVKRKRQT